MLTTGFYDFQYNGPIDTLQGKYTALPTIIYSWAGKPGEDALSEHLPAHTEVPVNDQRQ